MTPEMAAQFAELRKRQKLEQMEKRQPTISFNQYYNRRFLEEAKFFVENPKFSIKYMMVMTHLKQSIKEMCIKEYKQKYPGYPINENEIEIENEIENQGSDNNPESIVNGYDIIDDVVTFDDSVQNIEKPQLRRSKRLQNKNI